MASYTFQQMPPGKLLIQLLEKKFTGYLSLRSGRGILRVGFHGGRPVTTESQGAAVTGGSVREGLLQLFVDVAGSFEMEQGQVPPGQGISPLAVIREGVLTHYSKERLIGEAKELLKGPLTFVAGYDAYLPLYQFGEEDLAVVRELAEKPGSVRDLAERTGLALHHVIAVLYILALSRLITLHTTAEPAVAPEDQLSPEARNLLDELKKASLAMQSENVFARFGVAPTVTTEEVERIFKERARTFHPDIMQRKGLGAYVDLASAYFEKLTESYKILHDPRERERLRQAPASKEEEDNVRKVLEAEMSYQKALIHFRRKEYTEAEEHMKTAVKNAPDDGTYLGFWAWITYINPANNKDAIRDSIKRALIEAVELNKREATLHYYLGKVLLDAGQKGSAIQHLKRAVEINPNYIEASRELRMIERNRTRENLITKTGTFLNIFKKK